MTMEDILGTLATVTAIAMSCAPLLEDIPAIKRDRTTGDRSPTIFVAIWANSCLWIDYGIAAKAFHPISTTNLAGLVTGMYFLYIFYTYMPASQRSTFYQSLLPSIALVAAVYAYTFLFPDPDPAVMQLRLGLLCTVVTISVYASPVGTTWRALQLRAPQMISLRFVMVGAVNAVLWSGYGMLKHDPWVYVPNVLGSFIALMQAAVYAHLMSSATVVHYSKLPTGPNQQALLASVA